MTIDKIKLMIRALRPFSLTASVIPVTIGGILALEENKFNFEYFILAILTIILLQASVNLLSDHDDFENNVDTKDSYGSSGVIVEGLMTSNEVRIIGIVFFTLGCLLGLFLSFKRGNIVLVLGIIGTLSGYFYTGKPLKLKYRGLGAPIVFFIFGPLMVLGANYLQVQHFSLKPLLISIPLGLLTTAILHANDIRDMKHDRRADIKTLSILVGRKNADRIYCSLIIVSYALILVLVFYKIVPYLSLLTLVTLPVALKNINKLRLSNNSVEDILELDKETGKLQGQFGILLIISLLLYFT